MRLIQLTDEGVLELNWMWLPAWISFNSMILSVVNKELNDHVVGTEVTETNLDKLNDMAREVLIKNFPGLEGLGDYLDGIKFVQIGSDS